VVSEGHENVATFLNDGGAKVLVALDNKIVILASKVGQGTLLMGQEVAGAALLDELGLQRSFEVVSASNDGAGGAEGRWDFPGGFDVHPGVVITIGVEITSHKDLDFKVAIKAGPGSRF
jgi:hypothetical protein